MSHRPRPFAVLAVLGLAGARAHAQCIAQELHAEAGGEFAGSISLHGDEALVPGAIVYGGHGDEWIERARLVPPGHPPNTPFGIRVALGDGVAAVTSKWDGGGVHVFERGTHGWVHVARLRPVDSADAYLYVPIALSGEILVAGNPFDGHLGRNAGAVHVYERVGGAWRAAGTLRARNGEADEYFGFAVTVDERTVLASSSTWDPSGTVHVFDRATSDWRETSRMYGNDWLEQFGSSVALSGDRALVGGYPVDGDKGSAYLLRRKGDEWLLEAELVPNNSTGRAGFGWSVDLDGNCAVVGSVGFLIAKGRALLFGEREGTWHEIAVLLPVHEPTANTFLFGAGVSVSGGNAAAIDVGAHPYVYSDFDCAAVIEYCTASPNSSGYPAHMRHAGSLRVSDNDFELRASHCPSGETGFFFYMARRRPRSLSARATCASAPAQRASSDSLSRSPTST